MTNGHTRCENEATFHAVESALSNLWHVVNQLARIKPPKEEFYRVSIFGSARIKSTDPLYGEVKELARRLSQMGADIVTGGGPGLMEAANEGERLGDPENKTRSIGIRVALPFEQGANPFVEKVFMHETFFTRLHQFVRLSSAFIVMPGGIGTTLEAMMIWQLLQVRHAKEIPLIFVGEMWSGLVDWAKKYMSAHKPALANPEDLQIPVCVSSVDEAVAIIEKSFRRFEESSAE